MRINYILKICFILVTTGTTVQGSSGGPYHSLALNVSYVQIKDQFNYGLSFGGMTLNGRVELRWNVDNLDLSYSAELGMGAVHNKGAGILLSLKPLDGSAGFRLVHHPRSKVVLGPYLSACYRWQL
jgi:hypothetical protein